MTMNDITVGIYSYKGKKLFETIEQLVLHKSENTHLTINVKDQHPMDRYENFKDIMNTYNDISGSYHHVFWDWIVSPIAHKEELLRIAKGKYYLFLSDNVSVKKNWDKDLIDHFETNNSIISGCGKIKLKHKNLFYLDVEVEDSDNFTLSNYINRDFIFGTTDIFKRYSMPKYLKYDGEEEVLSLQYFTNNIDIFSAPSDMYSYNCETSIKNIYTPFQTSHYYNKAIRLIKNGQNEFGSVLSKIRDYALFWDYHKIDVKKIKYLPFENDDVLYNPNGSKYDKIDGRRFIDKQNEIN
jgi:hypothetical protein